VDSTVATVTEIRSYLQSHQFRKLFLERLGWDRAHGSKVLIVGEREFELELAAQKRGFLVLASRVHRTVLANRKLLRLQRLGQKL